MYGINSVSVFFCRIIWMKFLQKFRNILVRSDWKLFSGIIERPLAFLVLQQAMLYIHWLVCKKSNLHAVLYHVLKRNIPSDLRRTNFFIFPRSISTLCFTCQTASVLILLGQISDICFHAVHAKQVIQCRYVRYPVQVCTKF